MNLSEMYHYLVRARRDLWTALEAAPDGALSRKVVDGDLFHCIKDYVLHIAAVEDGWIHGDIQGVPLLLESIPAIRDAPEGPVFDKFPLAELLDYWRLVEKDTLAYLARLTPAELGRLVEEKYTVESLLWHVMMHEVRHTAQIALLLRQQGIKPPSLDLLFYLPLED